MTPTRVRYTLPRLLLDEPINATTTVAPSAQQLSSSTSVREFVSEQRDLAASLLRVTPAYIDVFVGCILFVLLNAATTEFTALALPGIGCSGIGLGGGVCAGGDTVVGRLAALGAFAAIQQLAFLPISQWLRYGNDEKTANPFFTNPIDGGTFGFLFAVPLAVFAQASGIDWLPEPRPFPPLDEAFLKAFVAPLSEEAFFRAFLCTALTVAGGSQAVALIASAVLFGLYHVPLATVLSPEGSSLLLLYQAFGAYLAFLYQRSGGSLPLAVATHCTCNMLVLVLRAVQWDSVLPF